MKAHRTTEYIENFQKRPSGRPTAWGIPLELTTSGAQKLRQACIDSGATTDPDSHETMMLLDGRTICAQPLSPDLATSIAGSPADNIIAMTRTGDEGKALALELGMCLKCGALPIKVEIAGAGNETDNPPSGATAEH